MCIQLCMVIHFLMADAPVEAAEGTQQGNKFIVNV